jgi:hypothetical protein
MDEIISYKMCAVKVRNAKLRNYLNNSEASEAITLKYTLLDRGKANLDFDILQLYIYKKLTEILMFKFDSIFLDVSKVW